MWGSVTQFTCTSIRGAAIAGNPRSRWKRVGAGAFASPN